MRAFSVPRQTAALNACSPLVLPMKSISFVSFHVAFNNNVNTSIITIIIIYHITFYRSFFLCHNILLITSPPIHDIVTFSIYCIISLFHVKNGVCIFFDYFFLNTIYCSIKMGIYACMYVCIYVCDYHQQIDDNIRNTHMVMI